MLDICTDDPNVLFRSFCPWLFCFETRFWFVSLSSPELRPTQIFAVAKCTRSSGIPVPNGASGPKWKLFFDVFAWDLCDVFGPLKKSCMMIGHFLTNCHYLITSRRQWRKDTTRASLTLKANKTWELLLKWLANTKKLFKSNNIFVAFENVARCIMAIIGTHLGPH